MGSKFEISVATDLISLIIAFASLVIALDALKISKETIALSSQAFLPRITVEIEEDGLKISNKDSDIFDIYTISLIQINTIGYWDNQRNGHILIPFLTNSYTFGDVLLNTPIKANEYFKFDSYVKYESYNIYDSDKYQEIYDYITSTYNNDSKLGYAAPTYFNIRYYIRITYFNEFNEIKNLYLAQTHIHGGGCFKRVISEDDYISSLEETNHPEFDSLQKALQYFSARFFTQSHYCPVKVDK